MLVSIINTKSYIKDLDFKENFLKINRYKLNYNIQNMLIFLAPWGLIITVMGLFWPYGNQNISKIQNSL